MSWKLEEKKKEAEIMETDPGDKTEVRLLLIGSRWSGKSYSGNTILQRERFEYGRIRTHQAELRHEEVEGRRLVVVDAPGWSNSMSLSEIPEVDKQRFKLNPSKCSPGPHVILLVIPIDTAFSVDQRKTLEEHMKLLGQEVWRFTLVLFSYGDYLKGMTIEQHIESEGPALQWLIQKCNNRYHVFNNKDKGNSSQALQLLEKIEDLVQYNCGNYYQTDEQTLKVITEKRRSLAERAIKRQRQVEEQRLQMKSLTDAAVVIPKLQIILLGSRNVGKTSVANAILGNKEHNNDKRTAQSVSRQGFFGEYEVNVVDTPGWWKAFSTRETPEAIKEEIMMSMFLCRPGPHVFLLVLDADASFSNKHLEAVRTHMALFTEDAWRRVMIVFTRADWLGNRSIEELIEGEGEALQTLVTQCGNRYHVVDTKYEDDGTQIAQLMQMIAGTAAQNDWQHLLPDEQIHKNIKEKRVRVEQNAKLRENLVKSRGFRNKQEELTLILVGLETSGKTATGNNLLQKLVFPTTPNRQSLVERGKVADRQVTVIDTPGWRTKVSQYNLLTDKEIALGLSQAPQGVHAVLLVVPLDLNFREVHQDALQDHMSLFDDNVWKHTVLVFTYGDKLADRTVEEHIESEPSALRWLVDKCMNRYHVVNNLKKRDFNQFAKLFEKVEEIVAENNGRLFCPDMSDIHMRIEEKISRGQLKQVLKQKLEEEYLRREVAMKKAFKETLLQIQAEIKANGPGSKTKLLVKGIGQKKISGKEKEDSVNAKICQEIKKLDQDIQASSNSHCNSKEFLIPNMSNETTSRAPSESSEPMETSVIFNKVLRWLSSLKLETNLDNHFTLNFSQTSGYRSEATTNVFDRDNDIPENAL